MNIESQEENQTKISKEKQKMANLEVSKETKKKITSAILMLNRKELGQPITPEQYLSLAISLLTPQHLEQLKTESLTNKDRLEIKYREHCKEQGRISMDEFLGFLLK
jgi:hypothetical protein